MCMFIVESGPLSSAVCLQAFDTGVELQRVDYAVQQEMVRLGNGSADEDSTEVLSDVDARRSAAFDAFFVAGMHTHDTADAMC